MKIFDESFQTHVTEKKHSSSSSSFWFGIACFSTEYQSSKTTKWLISKHEMRLVVLKIMEPN